MLRGRSLFALLLFYTGSLQTDASPPGGGVDGSVPASCSYRLSPKTGWYARSTGRGVFLVTTEPGCVWVAEASVPWITLDIANGTGNGVVLFAVAANGEAAARSGAIVIRDGVR